MHHLLGPSRVAGVLLACLLGACSSSDDNSPTRSTEIDVSTNELLFTAAGPTADAPAAQNVTATFGEGVVHLAVINNSTNVAEVTTVVSGQSAEITVTPLAPSDLGSGVFTAALAVTGYFCADASCTSLAAGNTQTVNIRYQISPVIERITPYVATAGVSDDAVIRGVGFGSFAPQGVRFGDVAATEFTLISDTEIRVTYPALPAGTYEIQIEIPEHEGDLESTASLLVLEPTDYAAQTLAYSGSVSTVNRVIYDAERGALLIATDAAVLRYPSEGNVWGTPTSTAFEGLRDVSLTMDGSQLLALTSGSLIPADPVSLARGTAIAPASALASGVFLKNIAVINDERGVITTGRNENSPSSLYFYSRGQTTLTQLTQQLNNATPAVSASGTSVIFVQGQLSASNNLPVYLFTTNNGQFEVTTASIHQNAVPPTVDRSGSRAVLNGTRVHGTQFQLFGTLPTSTTAVALKPDGTRAYAYDPTAGGIVTYNTSADNDENPYPAVGTTTPIAGDPGAGVKMTISSDGRTLFLAGNTRIVVQPTPTF